MLTGTQLDRLRVVLVKARNSLNIGAAARAMSNFGFTRLRVVNPYEPSFREARSAVGAGEVLAEAEQFDDVAKAVADCTLVVGTTAVRRRRLEHTVERLEAGARMVRRRLGTSRVALLFGSEKFGLTNEELSHCHWLMRVPTCEKNISMNLGQAVAVCLYELVRKGKAGSAEKLENASAGETERITANLIEALQASGFLDLRRVGDSELRIRRLVRRLRIPARDSVIWLGMLRQMLWKMQAGTGEHAGQKIETQEVSANRTRRGRSGPRRAGAE